MWNPFESGKTLGQRGSEAGEIIRDDEHSLGARITLEKATRSAPFAITCGIYSWMFHTRFFATEEEAASGYDKMKVSLAEIVAPFENPDYDDRLFTENAIEKFVAHYP
ncbi:MAG TPA: hypothetical protein VGF82_18095 [Terracidiphilus sp.]